MASLTFGGVSPRSLGDLLKGYGVMAIIAEHDQDALFWWDEASHLIIAGSRDEEKDRDMRRTELASVIGPALIAWARSMAGAFKPTRQKCCDKRLPCPDHPDAKPKPGKKTCPVVLVPRKDSAIKAPPDHDAFAPEHAGWARALAIALPSQDETEPHPLFPAHGQEASGDYFLQIEKAVEAASASAADLAWSLWGEGTPALNKTLDSGYLFFPEAMKRYATGVAKWEQDKAAISPWCFLLAVRGLLVLRGSTRRLRWGRRPYPAFPFAFDGATVELGKGKYFRNVEIHLPTWIGQRPRLFVELELQVRQFQARLSSSGFAATAAEFRAAVVGRGAGAAFDAFHRFVLEGRRPGQRQPMRQAIPRGLTRVGGASDDAGLLRWMLAPLAEMGWLDQFSTDRSRVVRGSVESAIDRAVDEPGLDSYRGVLDALWTANRALVTPGAVRRELEERRTPRPLSPLPADAWERAFREGLRTPAYRLGRALGSILGVTSPSTTIGPLLEHLIPVEYVPNTRRWKIADDDSPNARRRTRSCWTGVDPLADSRDLFWSRWLDSAVLDRLPFDAARTASLDDVLALLRGEVAVRDVARLAALFSLLAWHRVSDVSSVEAHGNFLAYERVTPITPSYAALRLWLEIGIRPRPDERPPRDGQIARLLSLGSPAQVARACELALARLRTCGLPWSADQPHPSGKGVARFVAVIPPREAARLALAIMIPIAPHDTLALSRRLWVAVDERQTAI